MRYRIVTSFFSCATLLVMSPVFAQWPERILIPYEETVGQDARQGIAAYEAGSGERLTDLLPATGQDYGLIENASWTVIPPNDVLVVVVTGPMTAELRRFEGITGEPLGVEVPHDEVLGPLREVLALWDNFFINGFSTYWLRYPEAVVPYDPLTGELGDPIVLEGAEDLFEPSFRWALGPGGVLYGAAEHATAWITPPGFCENDCNIDLRRWDLSTGERDDTFAASMPIDGDFYSYPQSFSANPVSGELFITWRDLDWDGSQSTNSRRRIAELDPITGEVVSVGFESNALEGHWTSVDPRGLVFAIDATDTSRVVGSLYDFQGRELRPIEVDVNRGDERVTGPARVTKDPGVAGLAVLQGGEFVVRVRYEDFGGSGSDGVSRPFSTEESAIFTFFSRDNWELLVKIVNGCSFNGHWWVFTSASTNAGYTVDISDRQGREWSLSNSPGTAAPATTDTSAFPCE